MTKKIKIFFNESRHYLEEDINKFLNDNNKIIIDIKFSTDFSDNYNCFNVLIFYDDNKIGENKQ